MELNTEDKIQPPLWCRVICPFSYKFFNILQESLPQVLTSTLENKGLKKGAYGQKLYLKNSVCSSVEKNLTDAMCKALSFIPALQAQYQKKKEKQP